MNGFENALVWFGVFLIYFLVEFFVSLLFTYKISFVSKDDFQKAAIFGSISTFLFMFSTLNAAYFASQTSFIDDWFFSSSLLFLFWTTVSLTIGNFFATILVPKINKLIEKKNKGKKE